MRKSKFLATCPHCENVKEEQLNIKIRISSFRFLESDFFYYSLKISVKKHDAFEYNKRMFSYVNQRIFTLGYFPPFPPRHHEVRTSRML